MREDTNMRHPVWTTVGGVVLLALAVGLISMAPDIKRYIRISTM